MKLVSEKFTKANNFVLLQMEQIKRANRMYTNDSIFLRKSLSIPVLSDLDGGSNGLDLAEQDDEKDTAGCAPPQNGHTGSSSENKKDGGKERASDLTPVDFLKRLDDLINQSKQAAVKGCEEAEKRYACMASTVCLYTCYSGKVYCMTEWQRLVIWLQCKITG